MVLTFTGSGGVFYIAFCQSLFSRRKVIQVLK